MAFEAMLGKAAQRGGKALRAGGKALSGGGGGYGASDKQNTSRVADKAHAIAGKAVGELRKRVGKRKAMPVSVGSKTGDKPWRGAGKDY